MSIWFLLWFVLSFILLGATCWSTIILIQQKKAWKDYATKKGLSFTPGEFFEPATVEGTLDGYNVSLFTATQQNQDARKNRQLTVLQVTVNEVFVDGIGCGTKEMLPFLQSLEAITPHEVKVGKWNKNNDIRSRNKKAVDAYLTEERVSILNGILSMPNADIVILFDDRESIFRFETTNPLTQVGQIDSVINKLIARIKKLKPDSTESKKLADLSQAGSDVKAPAAEQVQAEKAPVEQPSEPAQEPVSETQQETAEKPSDAEDKKEET